MNPNQLVFEISETAAISKIDVTLDFIRQIRELGGRFSLDDFGSGFSSFYYLKCFDAGHLKINGGFIRDLCNDNRNQIFVKAHNDVAGGMGKQVIAEWVETPDALKILQEIGAEYGQGYLFNPPVMLDEKRDACMAGSDFAA